MIHYVRNDVIIITGTRKLLNGMSITGSASNGNRTQLYKDASDVWTCDGRYQHAGSSVCSDIITIPINHDRLIRNITISDVGNIILCEVEVFAGKRFKIL